MLRHHIVVNDLFDRAVALVQVDTSRDVTHFGLRTIRLSLVGMCVAALVIGLAFHLILVRWVFNPIISVRRRMVDMLDSGELQPIGLTQKDEVGAMSRAFDRLIVQLQATQEDLAVKRNDALAASRAKGEFLARMSHEIRTPMNGVLGMTELLGATSLDDQQARFVATIRNSGELLLSVINDILDFSKIESGKLSLEMHSFNLRDLA
jgi:signal transduction histidine kinase